MLILKRRSEAMDIIQATNQTIELQKLYDNWEKQGLTEEQVRIRINVYLDEKKRKVRKLERTFG